MDKYREMQSFAAVVDAGSFVRAAETLNTSKAAVSRHVADLEQRLGVRLLHRTTRRLSLTDEGQTFYQQSRDILATIEEAEAQANSGVGEVSGLLRINAPVSFGILHLAPLWGAFASAHPKVALEVSLADRIVDLVEEGYDLAVRVSRLSSSTLISRRLATTRLMLCASPEYLQEHGRPRHPEDLSRHAVISYSYFSGRDEWEFHGPAGTTKVRLNPRIHTNNGDTCRAAALAHQGIIMQPSFLVGNDIQAGLLEELLPAYLPPELGVYAVYASRKQQPLKLRRMIEFLLEAFKTPRWPQL